MTGSWAKWSFPMAVTLSVIAASSTAMTGLPTPWAPWKMDRKWSEFDKLPRHEFVRSRGVPQPYANMHNPFDQSRTTLGRGAAIYDEWCASCHGRDGEGDGPAGRTLTAAPGDLAWLAEMKLSRSDGFMYWTIAEGGAPIGSAMPAYARSLSPQQIWEVTAYIQFRLPRTVR